MGKRRGEWKLIMICFRGNINIPKLLVVMVEQYMNIQKKKIAHFKWLGFKVCTYCLRMKSIMEMAGWWFTSELFPISWEN